MKMGAPTLGNVQQNNSFSASDGEKVAAGRMRGVWENILRHESNRDAKQKTKLAEDCFNVNILLKTLRLPKLASKEKNFAPQFGVHCVRKVFVLLITGSASARDGTRGASVNGTSTRLKSGFQWLKVRLMPSVAIPHKLV